ncbi:hypothetical protein BH10BAC6_BH10BAC6_13430 [soil metagenome]
MIDEANASFSSENANQNKNDYATMIKVIKTRNHSRPTSTARDMLVLDKCLHGIRSVCVKY